MSGIDLNSFFKQDELVGQKVDLIMPPDVSDKQDGFLGR